MAPPERSGLWAGLKLIYERMSPQRRRQLLAVLLLMCAGAIAEVATIGAVIPFIALLAGGSESLPSRFRFIPSIGDPRIVAAATFIAIAVVAGLIRILLARASRSFIFQLGHELSIEIQRRVLSQPFSFHIDRNTSSLLASLNKNETLVFDVLLPFMHAVTAAVIAVVILAMLLVVAPLTTASVAATFVATYGLISLLTRRRLAANSEILETAFDDRVKVMQESLGGIRDVIVDNSQAMYLREFESVDFRLASVRAANQFIAIAPRYLIEMIGMIVIAIIAFTAARGHHGLTAALPVLGAVALGAQRLLPLVQEVYAGWSTLEGQRSIFEQVIGLLRLSVRESVAIVVPLELRESVRLENVSFTYASRSHPALADVNLTIARGSMLALVGPTGSGKSTLVDVLMGLLESDTGRILLDDVALTETDRRQWHRSIAHVPQSIFLTDSTIARNIALSLPDDPPDAERIVDAAEKAQLHDFIQSLPAGYETRIGERGIRLSGGQRQRLGIARAIYKDAPILILDEATSALDDGTESAVIAALDELRRERRTIIIVAHRLSTIRHCDTVARLQDGRLVEFGPFERVVGPKLSPFRDASASL